MRDLKRQVAFLAAAVLLSWAFAAAQSSCEERAQDKLPEETRVRLRTSGILVRYDLATNLDPSCLRGDFDGDGKPDYAIFVIRKATRKHGIAIVRSSVATVDVLGAGGTKLRVGSPSDSYLLEDFDWMDEWHIQPKQKVILESGSKIAANMRGDGIVVEKSESASGLVFWDGTHWLWRQMGD